MTKVVEVPFIPNAADITFSSDQIVRKMEFFATHCAAIAFMDVRLTEYGGSIESMLDVIEHELQIDYGLPKLTEDQKLHYIEHFKEVIKYLDEYIRPSVLSNIRLVANEELHKLQPPSFFLMAFARMSGVNNHWWYGDRPFYTIEKRSPLITLIGKMLG